MRLRVTLNLGEIDYPGHSYLEDQVIDASADLGRKLITRGHAVEVPPETPLGLPKKEAAPVAAAAAPKEPDHTGEKTKKS